MLTDAALKQLKQRGKPYKITDRDGMYAHVSASGTVTFRYDYRLNGRRETIVLGRYGRAGISLAIAREKCLDARRSVSTRSREAAYEATAKGSQELRRVR